MIVVILIVFGLLLGSFFHALVWRIHSGQDMVRDRSRCESCDHVLSWYDLLPVVSWVSLGGKCRYCQAAISWHHPVFEATAALLFVVSYMAWPYALVTVPAWVMFACWLLLVVANLALLVYDLRWMLLPDVLTYPLVVVAVVYAALKYVGIDGYTPIGATLEIAYGAASISGIYGLLYLVSRGKWVGLGDIKLGISMGIVLGWMGGIFVIALANFIGLLVILPALIIGKLTRKSVIPFGPFLIIAFLIAVLWGRYVIDWYVTGFTSLV